MPILTGESIYVEVLVSGKRRIGTATGRERHCEREHRPLPVAVPTRTRNLNLA